MNNIDGLLRTKSLFHYKIRCYQAIEIQEIGTSPLNFIVLQAPKRLCFTRTKTKLTAVDEIMVDTLQRQTLNILTC